MRWIAIVIACTACGRIGFDATGGATGDGSHGEGTGGSRMLVLRDKSNGYTGTTDTYIDALNPTVMHHLDTVMSWGLTDRYALIHFDSLFGTSTIPQGATIQSATLRMVFDTACPQPTTIREIAVGWASTVTWDMFGSMAGVQASDMRGANVTLPAVPAGPATVDLTLSVAAWSLDPTRNEGWMLFSSAASCSVLSTESADASMYPELTVVYDP